MTSELASSATNVKRQSASRVPSWVFYGLVFNLIFAPLLFGSNRPEFWALPLIIWNLLTIATALYIKDVAQLRRAPFHPIHLAFIPLLCVIGWQLVMRTSFDLHATQTQLMKTIALMEALFLTLILVDSRRRLLFLVNALLLAGVFQAVYGALMTLTGTDYIWNQPKEVYKGVATGTFVNRNHLAGYLEMMLALGIGLMIASLEEGRARTWRQWLRGWTTTLLGPKARVRIYLALMVIGLILTQSRMGNTAFFGSMMVAGAIGLVLFRRSGRGVVLLFASMLIIDIVLMGTFFGIDKVQKRLEQTNLQKEQRILVNKLSLPIIEDHPWIGTGLGTYYTAFPQYRNGEVYLFYRHAHSDMIEFPSELGVLGFLPLVLLVAHAFYTAIRVQISRRSRLMRAMGFASTMAIIAIMMHSITDFNLQIFGNAATFMVILALPYICMNLEKRGKSQTSRKPPPGGAAIPTL